MSEESGTGRSKRVSTGKQKRLNLLEKLRSGRNKYEVGELENVYDEVDEREYSKKVLERQDDDWIVDDGGCGYVEDGREIFDDDLDEESISKSKPLKVGSKRPRDVCRDEKKGNVGKMLMNMPAKKKKEVVKIDEDDVLGNIINELGDDPSKSQQRALTQPSHKDVAARDYLKSLAAPKIKPKPIKMMSNNSHVDSKSSNFAQSKENGVTNSKSDNCSVSVVEVNSTSSQLKEPCANFNEDIIPLSEIKQEPIYVDDIDEELGESIAQAFDDDDVEMVQAHEPIPIPTEDLSIEKDIIKSPEPISKAEDEVSEDWNTNSESDLNSANIPIDKSNPPLDCFGILKFYYIDAHEELNQPGVVYLFGKVCVVASYFSCCVVVRNIQRQIFLLPRSKRFDMKTKTETNEDVSMSDVYDEFNKKISPKYKIFEFKSRKVTKKYAFGKEEIPLESEYLEVRYSAGCQALPTDLCGETFSRVFGCRTSFLELFFLERGIKGPTWLNIQKPVPNSAPCSWCKFEVTVTDLASIVIPKYNCDIVPPLVLMTIAPQAVYNPKNKQTEIVAIGCVVQTSYPLDKSAPTKLFNQHFCLLSKPSDVAWPYDIQETAKNFKKTTVQRVDSERALLNCFLTKLFVIDADIIVGHDLSGFAVDLIMTRLAYRRIPNWSRFGRLRRNNVPSHKNKSQLEKMAVTGRLVCDIKVSAKELIRSRSYDLSALCHNVLHFPEDKRPEITDEDFKYAYSSGSTLYGLVWNLMSDASYILKIFADLNVLPLALQITNIAGNVMSRTLMGGRSERNEFLLLHAFYAKGYILPDKEFKKKDDRVDNEHGEGAASKSNRKKPTYAGGLVLDPKIGFYDDLILLMDFNSLYPSIIQEYNICFSTIPLHQITMDDHFLDEFAKFLPCDSVEKGILPTEIRKLVESRKDVKKLLKNSNLSEDLKKQYDIRQTALKLTANSMYGCLGFAYSRFYAKELAAMITAKGREILMNTKRVVESYGYDVIYGDTDSIMINTKVKDFEQVYSVGRRIKGEVNKFYKQVELDIDGVFKYMLLLRKKKYAAVTLSKNNKGELMEKQEMKGIDIVRRDWSQLAGEAGKVILKQILSDNSCEDKIESIQGYLETIRQDLEEGKVPLSLLEVTKQLTKDPTDYADSKSLPHVLVALRMNKGSSKKFKQGDTVSYVICMDGTPNPATQRAYHSEELKSNENLKVDIEYYLAQQIHPVIARLCDPIEGIDAASIARCLGLDPTKYKRNVRENNTELDEHEGLFGKDDEERFKDCTRFSFRCESSSCGMENLVDHPMRKRENGMKELFLDHCVNADCKLRPVEYLTSIQNQLHLKVREFIHDFHKGPLVCENPLCGFETYYLNPVFKKMQPECTKCLQSVMRKEETPMHLYNQLVLFAKTFDLTRASSKVAKFDPDTVDAYRKVEEQMKKVIALNKYSEVDLGHLFSQLCLPKTVAKRKSSLVEAIRRIE